MEPRESAFWVDLKAKRWLYTLSILATLAVGILIGSVVSYGVKGKEGQQSADAKQLTVPAPQQLSNAFSQIAKQLEPAVVNINTESTIKNPHKQRRGARPGPGDQDNDGSGAAPGAARSTISLIASLVAKAGPVVVPAAATSRSARWAPACSSIPRVTSLPTVT